MPALIHSYTSLNCYASICPHQYHRRYIAKDIPFKETEAMRYGTEAHSALEYRVSGGKPLPDEMRHWEPLAEPFAKRNAQTELKLAVNYEYKPVDFWAKDAFLRGKADVVLRNGTRAHISDWKTGRPREEPFELEVQALLLKALYPELELILGNYIWLKDCSVGKTHDLSDTSRTRNKVATIARAIEQDRTFEKRPGPLCGWCDVLDCEHNRKET
jgi:hypothetical protein